MLHSRAISSMDLTVIQAAVKFCNILVRMSVLINANLRYRVQNLSANYLISLWRPLHHRAVEISVLLSIVLVVDVR